MNVRVKRLSIESCPFSENKLFWQRNSDGSWRMIGVAVQLPGSYGWNFVPSGAHIYPFGSTPLEAYQHWVEFRSSNGGSL